MFCHYRSFQVSSEIPTRFKKYCFYVLAYVSVLTILLLETQFKFFKKFINMQINAVLFQSFILASTISAVCLVLAGIKVFNLSRKSNLSSHNEFEVEKERWKAKQTPFIIISKTLIFLPDFGIIYNFLLFCFWRSFWNYSW